jgi:hypothetical protein
VGVHLFAHGLDQQHAFGPVVVRLQQVIAAHKRAHSGDDFALLHNPTASFNSLSNVLVLKGMVTSRSWLT